MTTLEKGPNWTPISSFPYKILSNDVHTWHGDPETGIILGFEFPGSFPFLTTLTLEDFDNPLLFDDTRKIKHFLIKMMEVYR